MSYRPITDVWILARAKLRDGHKYYGAYPAGFLHRARHMLGVRPCDPVLHVCSGKVDKNLYSGFGPNDKTLDLDPALNPDFHIDARDIGSTKGSSFPRLVDNETHISQVSSNEEGQDIAKLGEWGAILIDRPYTREDAKHYAPGEGALPNLNDLLKHSLSMLPIGRRVGVIDYLWPHPGKWGKEVAVIGVGTGRNNRARWFTVFERIKDHS